MPPEPLPWVRKDLIKERKHERSEASSLGSTPRWRDASSGHYGQSRDFSRYGGHGKNGGWNPFSKESGHVSVPFRSNDKMPEAENGRLSVSRVDGKYGRNIRESRETFSQKDWKGHSLDMINGHAGTHGRLHDVDNVQRSAYDMVANSSSLPTHPEFVSTWDEVHLKEQHDNGKITGVNGLGTLPKGDHENSLEWKPFRWSRTGSISSRGSGFSHSGSSKSLADSVPLKAELQPKDSTPVNSPTGDAVACFTPTAASEDVALRRKKARLGWGEGLAKYEKKKVEVSDVNVNEDGVIYSGITTETMYSQSSNLVDKSPRVVRFPDCASPATPSSAAYSSSPGIEEKVFYKTLNVDNDISNLCGSPSIGSQSIGEGSSCNLEKFDVSSLDTISSSLLELLHNDDPGSTDGGFVRSTAMSKLLVWKGDILKELETTESEIDLLDSEHRALRLESGSGSTCLASSASVPSECGAMPGNGQKTAADHIPQPSPLQVGSCVDEFLGKVPSCSDIKEEHVKDGDINCTETVASELLEPLAKAASPSGCSTGPNIIQSTTKELDCLVSRTSDDGEAFHPSEDANVLAEDKDGALFLGNTRLHDTGQYNLCDSILISNKNSADRASDVFINLLASGQWKISFSPVTNLSSWQNNTLVVEKFIARKRYLRFKEKVVTFKFKAFHRLWKEDLRLQSIGKHRAKSQKKLELNMRTAQSGHQKHRSSLRLRYSPPSATLSSVPITEILNFTTKLLSEPHVQSYRDALRMPAVILDKKQKIVSRFGSNNGLVEDPCAVEKERALINPWTSEETEIFIDKLTTVGKDFRKIASFLEHKTTADCVEFYYKNHKSFGKTKQIKCAKSSNNYMVASAKKLNHEVNPASLDILGATLVMGANAEKGMITQRLPDYQIVYGGYSDSKVSHGDDGILEKSSDFDFLGNERETEAANALVGICGSITSDAMGSCITGSVDPSEGSWKRMHQKPKSIIKMPRTSSASQNIDEDTCADDSCSEVDHADWNDNEKSLFIQAVSSYGKDFSMIARCVKTRSRDQCKVFFSKARKCLGLDSIHVGSGNIGTSTSDNANGGGSDTEGAGAIEIGSVICSDKLSSKTDDEFLSSVKDVKLEESDTLDRINLHADLNKSEDSNSGSVYDQDDARVSGTVVSDACQIDRPELDVDFTSVNGHVQPSKSSDAHGTAFESIETETVGDKVTEKDTDNAKLREEVDPVLSNRIVAVEVAHDVLPNGIPLLHQNATIKSNVPLDTSSCSDKNVDVENGHREVSSELNSGEKAPVALLQDNNLVSLNARMQDSADISVGESRLDLPPTNGLLETYNLQSHNLVSSSDYFQQNQSSNPLGTHNNSLQLIGCCPLPVTSKKKMNGHVSCGSLSEVQSLLSSERIVNGRFVAEDCHLQNGSSSKAQHLVPAYSIMPEFKGQANDHLQGHSRSLSDTEKPCRNGNVKLFGTILGNSSSVQKSNSYPAHGTDEKGTNSKPSCMSSSKRVAGQYDTEGNAGPLKFDHNGHLDLENIAVRSLSLWDRNAIRAGFSTLPDSTLLLAKYPAAFSDYNGSSSKMAQPGLHSVVKSNDGRVNGISGLPLSEVSSSNGVVVDHQIHRSWEANKVQPFTLERRLQQQDMVVVEMNRRNGFEAISSLQPQPQPQQGRGLNTLGGMNVVGRGGIVVGGQCGIVSDPVTAIKMHYAQSDHRGCQNGIHEQQQQQQREGNLDR